MIVGRPDRLPATQVLAILTDVARALDYAHAKGVIHRDIKPSNIMVQDDGAVKVMDFGIAKLVAAETITAAMMVIGTPHYLSPEQLQAQPLSGRSDQFSLAVVAYALLTGKKPFDADTQAALFMKLLMEEQPRSGALNAEMDRVLRTALSKEPAQRFENCTAFIGALNSALLSQSEKETVLNEQPRLKLKTWPIAATLVVALAVAAAGYHFWPRSQATATVVPSTGAGNGRGSEKVSVSEGPAAGATLVNPKDGLTYVWIQSGTCQANVATHLGFRCVRE